MENENRKGYCNADCPEGTCCHPSDCQWITPQPEKEETCACFTALDYVNCDENCNRTESLSQQSGEMSAEEQEKITGFKTPAEFHAYQKGREHEERTIIKFIESWGGSENSAMGGILASKFASYKSQQEKEISDDVHEKEAALQAFDEVQKLFAGKWWLTEGRGPYPYDDDRYKQEVRYMLEEFEGIKNKLWKEIKTKTFEYRNKLEAQFSAQQLQAAGSGVPIGEDIERFAKDCAEGKLGEWHIEGFIKDLLSQSEQRAKDFSEWTYKNGWMYMKDHSPTIWINTKDVYDTHLSTKQLYDLFLSSLTNKPETK